MTQVDKILLLDANYMIQEYFVSVWKLYFKEFSTASFFITHGIWNEPLIVKLFHNFRLLFLSSQFFTSFPLRNFFNYLYQKRFMVKPQTSDIWMTYEHIQVTCGWHTSTYEYIRVTYGWHMSGLRMTYKYIGVTYGWHTSTYERHTSTYEWHTNDIRVYTNDIRMTYEWHVKLY